MARPAKSYKTEAQYWERRYNELKAKTQHNDKGEVVVEPAKPLIDNKPKKEAVEAPQVAETALNNQPLEDTLTSEASVAPKTEAEVPPMTTEASEPSLKGTPKPEELDMEARQEAELEIEKEPEEANPDDYDYCCSECKELFNEAGNKTDDGGIKCPSCQEVF